MAKSWLHATEAPRPVAIIAIYHAYARACVQTAIGRSNPRMVSGAWVIKGRNTASALL